MSTFYISGSTVNNNKSAISMATNLSSRTDVTEVGQKNPTKYDNQAVPTKDCGQILRTASGTVADMQNWNGNAAFELDSVYAAGTSIQILGASYPHNGTYGVIGSSGTYTVTDVPYLSCTGINLTNAKYSVGSGTFTPVSQRQYIMQKVTTSIAGQGNTVLQTGKSNGSSSLAQFRGYRSRVYAAGWQSFSGSVSPCNVTTTNVSLATDDAVSGHTVILNVAGNVKAADITVPDTVGLRAPA